MLIQNSCEKHNRDGVSRDSIPQDVVPTHAVWTSCVEIGQRHEIDCPIAEFWLAALSFLSPSQFFDPIFHAVRSDDGTTIYFVPVLTDVVWRGTC